MTSLLLVLPFFSRVIIACGTKLVLGKVIGAGVFFSFNSILILPASVMLFVWFLELNISISSGRSVINWIAPATFGVYLIHDNKYMSKVIWDYVRERVHLEQFSLVYECLISVILIFAVCMLIDKIRELFFRPLRKINIGTQINKIINDIYEN